MCLIGCAPRVGGSPATEATAPLAQVPELDGAIREGEWAQAMKHPLGERGQVHALRSGDTVWIAARGGADGIASVCVGSADRVWILHASAALGTGEYELAQGGWQRRRDFAWAARDPSDSAAREEFFSREGWLANVSKGGADREFELDLRRFPPGVRFAVGYLHTREPMRVDTFPERVTDACSGMPLQQGALPQTAAFAPETWEAFP